MKSLCMWYKYLLKESRTQANSLKSPKEPLYLEKSENLFSPALQRCSSDFTGCDSRVKHLGLAVLQTQLQNRSRGYELLTAGKLRQFG